MFRQITQTSRRVAVHHKRHLSISSSGLHGNFTAVLGAQWGDEGKGKLCDVLAEKYDLVARFNGGNNAGHTIKIGEKSYAFHLLPCGLIYDHTINIIGNGTVVNLDSFFNELKPLKEDGINTEGRIKISDRAQLAFNLYKNVDEIIEKKRGKSEIGTTKKGIGPAYAAKALRLGLRVGDLVHWEEFEKKYSFLASSFEDFFQFTFDKAEELAQLKNYREQLLSENIIEDCSFLINHSLSDGKRILVEGANAAMLDLDLGSYPFVTSSTTTAGNINTGLGTSEKPQSILGVTEIGRFLQEVGREFGVTTGRRRRCGWLDTVILRYANAVNGFTGLNLTKLDVLDGLDEVKMCVDYEHVETGEKLNRGAFPSSMERLAKYRPIYKSFPGWKTDISQIRNFEDLPSEAQVYIKAIEEEVGVPISWIGVGAERDAMVLKE
eukprot:maker-scaffold_1-snap-gene-19.27-mRNA-1 protein AED:0.04 eAED:0.04 QI:66/0/0.5/1/0/0/2/0/435